jgi:hypothetical protein
MKGPRSLATVAAIFSRHLRNVSRRLGRREFADENKELRAALHQYAKRERRIADASIPTAMHPPRPISPIHNLDQ